MGMLTPLQEVTCMVLTVGKSLEVFGQFGYVASLVYVIVLWHHHHVSSPLSVYSDPGYIFEGRNLICGSYTSINAC